MTGHEETVSNKLPSLLNNRAPEVSRLYGTAHFFWQGLFTGLNILPLLSWRYACLLRSDSIWAKLEKVDVFWRRNWGTVYHILISALQAITHPLKDDVAARMSVWFAGGSPIETTSELTDPNHAKNGEIRLTYPTAHGGVAVGLKREIKLMEKEILKQRHTPPVSSHHQFW